ncbi:MAG TPA: TMEM175 family protein [Candidatus Nitrosocosmicus sp.]
MIEFNNVRLEHVISFGDAVFAFAITFMAISIPIPECPTHISESQVLEKIMQMQPDFQNYFLSYFVIGIFWVKYHSIFNKIKETPNNILWLTLLFLFCITLISFATALRLKNDEYLLTFDVYAIILIISSILLSAIGLVSLRDNMEYETMTKIQKRFYIISGFVPVTIFASSMEIATINQSLAQFSWILIIPMQNGLIKKSIKIKYNNIYYNMIV